ncbi:MAG: YncE family protein, partial [Deltaproteobacteria bacterium]|nr:YncE family protein [Deltaproteobacteria bacterium]
TITLASQPLSVTIDPEGVKAYFLTAGSDQMSVVDTNKNQVVATVPVGPAPGDIAVTYHKYNNLYVTNSTKGTVTCYDNQTFIQKTVITVGQKPTKMAISYDWEWLMVVNTGDNNLSVIQISTNTQTAVLPLGNAPSDIIASIMDRKMFVINTGDNTISGISVGDKIVTGTVPIGQGPWRMAYAQNGGKVFVLNQGDETVSFIGEGDTSLRSTLSLAGMKPMGICPDYDNNYVYVAQYANNSVAVLNNGDENINMLIPVGQGPTDVGFINNPRVGKYVYVSNLLSSSVTVITSEDNSNYQPTLLAHSIVTTIPLSDKPRRIFMQDLTRDTTTFNR